MQERHKGNGGDAMAKAFGKDDAIARRWVIDMRSIALAAVRLRCWTVLDEEDELRDRLESTVVLVCPDWFCEHVVRLRFLIVLDCSVVFTTR
jgi:hypothetical protein